MVWIIIINFITLFVVKELRVYFTVSLSNSMYPVIKQGNLILVKDKYRFEKLKERDIIYFKVNSISFPIMHRIVDKTKEGFITKGDNNKKVDNQTVTEENYIGKVLYVLSLRINRTDIKTKTVYVNMVFYFILLLSEWVLYLIILNYFI